MEPDTSVAVLALLIVLFVIVASRSTVRPSQVASTVAIVGILFLAGCLTRVLRGPAEDHYVQTVAIAASCKVDGYEGGKCTADDLEAMAEQARCLAAIAKRKRCEAREPSTEEPGGS